MAQTIYRPAVEELEARRLLAGNVSALVSQGRLFLTGDAQDNTIRLSSPEPALLLVEGLSGTTINGAGTQEFRGITGKVDVRLKAGNDGVVVLNGVLPGTLVLGGAGGDDNLVSVSSLFGGNLKFLGGAGSDGFNCQDSTIAGNGIVHLGHGGAFPQDITLMNSTVGRNWTATAEGAAQNDLVFNQVQVLGQSTLKMAGGDDDLTIQDSTFLGRFNLYSGGGMDEILLDVSGATGITAFGARVDVQTGGGNDTVILGEAGDPNRQVVFRHRATFDGGPGLDTLNDENSVKEGDFIAVSF